MPIYSDPYDGSGGGSTSSVCSISPSDLVAIQGNIINRVSDLERFLSRVVAADVHASNLADLAENMGNLLNGTLMMPYSPNDAWAGEGGSIAVPDGFTGTYVSGGVTTIWNDGVVTFEVAPRTGITTGFSFAQVGIVASANTVSSVEEAVDPGNILTCSGTDIVISNSGLYAFLMQDDMTISVAAATYGYLQVDDSSFGLPGANKVCGAGHLTTGSTGGIKFVFGAGSGTITTIPSGAYHLTVSCAVSGAGTWAHAATVSVLKIM